MVGRFFHILGDVIQYFGYFGLPHFDSEPVIAHFHDWASTFGLMFTKSKKLTGNVTTVYTPHQSPPLSGNQIKNFSNMEELPACDQRIDTMYKAIITSSKSSKTS